MSSFFITVTVAFGCGVSACGSSARPAISTSPAATPGAVSNAPEPAQRGDGGRIIATFDEKDLVTEGIARDDKTGMLFVSSAHKRKIFRVTPEGAISEWKHSGEDELDGVLGMDVDTAHRTLFVCSTMANHVEGFGPSTTPRAAVIGFDLDTGRRTIRQVITGPGEHACNDLAVDRDGTVIVSDTGANELLRFVPSTQTLSTLVPHGHLKNPQGIAPTADALFVADYPRGIAKVDRATGESRLLSGPSGVVLGGIDGLRAVAGGFIAIQNGTSTHRILFLQSDGTAIQSARILAKSDPRWHEPTLGIVVGGDFVYVAASQWEALGQDGKIAHPESLVSPILMKMPLPAE